MRMGSSLPLPVQDPGSIPGTLKCYYHSADVSYDVGVSDEWDKIR